MTIRPLGETVENAKELLPIRVVAERLDVSEKTIRRMVEERKFPKPRRLVSGQPRWLQSDLQAFLDALRLGILIDGREDAEGVLSDHAARKKTGGESGCAP